MAGADVEWLPANIPILIVCITDADLLSYLNNLL